MYVCVCFFLPKTFCLCLFFYSNFSFGPKTLWKKPSYLIILTFVIFLSLFLWVKTVWLNIDQAFLSLRLNIRYLCRETLVPSIELHRFRLRLSDVKLTRVYLPTVRLPRGIFSIPRLSSVWLPWVHCIQKHRGKITLGGVP